MHPPKDIHQEISEIRSLMERSSRFISLSGLSGIFAGIFALGGAAIAYLLLKKEYGSASLYQDQNISPDLIQWLLLDALGIIVLAVATGIYFTTRNAKKKGLKTWDHTTKRVLSNLLLPLATGGLFCLILIFQQFIVLVAPATLIFYGLALINASKYTLSDIRYLGIIEISLGLLASFFLGYGLLFWSIGFGLMHILYGTIMYFKYEK
ncbi:hypothetical protein AAG747_18100 [Rapidithrix thailandica]|uniref:Uncharacterized protein n=1 Tax=Rapidithrix thailandica TaxID=413964 RepID=A0AAW9SEV8_9BACT